MLKWNLFQILYSDWSGSWVDKNALSNRRGFGLWLGHSLFSYQKQLAMRGWIGPGTGFSSCDNMSCYKQSIKQSFISNENHSCTYVACIPIPNPSLWGPVQVMVVNSSHRLRPRPDWSSLHHVRLRSPFEAARRTTWHASRRLDFLPLWLHCHNLESNEKGIWIKWQY